jgi:phosphatidylglycerophosphatase A
MELGPKASKSKLDCLSVALATGFYLSYIPVKFFSFRAGRWTGAGLVGTLEGFVLVPFLPSGPLYFAFFLGICIGLAVWLCSRVEKVWGRRDDPRIVFDEIVGYWTAVAFLPRTAAMLAAGFLIFRLLDSVKLPPLRELERLPEGWGVVADDVGAGIIANLVLRLLLGFWPSLAS